MRLTFLSIKNLKPPQVCQVTINQANQPPNVAHRKGRGCCTQS